jgi:hypothetical protein
MIHPISPPPLPGFGSTSWWDWLAANTLLYWVVLLGTIVCIGYIVWIAYSAIRARTAEPSASFVSLACAERMAKSGVAEGGRHFLVYTHSGFPDVQQFEHVLPSDERSFRLTYRNEVHRYGFRLTKRAEGEYDVFILNAPRYEGRPSDAESSFRSDVGTARERIAYAPGMEPTDLPDAVRKTIFWAEANSRYIVNGHRWLKQQRGGEFRPAEQRPKDRRQRAALTTH